MDREGMNELIAKGPIRILMNDGNEFTVESPELITVSDIAAAVLYRSKEDGKLRHMILPLVTMSGVEPLSADI